MNTQEVSKSNTDSKRGLAGYAIQSTIFAGPIPPAEELAKYEKILPGSADRILKMAEKQSTHRRELENKILESNIKTAATGQVFGFTIFTLALIAGVVLILLGKNGEGLVTSLSSLAIIIGIFIYDRADKRQELQNKTKK